MLAWMCFLLVRVCLVDVRIGGADDGRLIVRVGAVVWCSTDETGG
jgi:hypothetical protein